MAKINIPYTPRPLQMAFHNAGCRYIALLTHRRFGKTVCVLNDLIRDAVRRGNEVRGWRGGYIAPYLKQAKDVAWDYLKFYAGVLPGVRFHETELRADFKNGARIRLYGADNAEALRGQYLDYAVLDEAADISRSVWQLQLRPMLADRQGRVVFCGTPQGMNNLLYDVFQQAQSDAENWRLFVYKASETGYVPEEELAKARNDMGEDEYNQEFECSFAAAVRGAYWAREIDALESLGRVTAVPWEPALPVNTAWDLGMDDATSIWFFQVEPSGFFRDAASDSAARLGHGPLESSVALDARNGLRPTGTSPSGRSPAPAGLPSLPAGKLPTAQIPDGSVWRVIDYYEASGEGLEHYRDVLNAKGYKYGRHIAPHDIAVRELGTGKSRLETARALGIRFIVARNLPVIDGISAVRKQLPRCWFDARKCGEGIKALRQYRKTFNERMDVYGKPQHDWTSHSADSFRYAVVGMMPESKGERQEKTLNWKG